MAKNITKWFTIISTAIILIYDFIIWCMADTPATISAYIWELSDKSPVMPFAWGFLMGHLFWARKPEAGNESKGNE